MSLESVEQFYQKVSQDQSLQQRLQSATDQDSLVNLAVQLGKEQGYNFTADEAKQSIANAKQTRGAELSDEQLEAVAGGSKQPGYTKGGVVTNCS